jgi:hypothetical protein
MMLHHQLAGGIQNRDRDRVLVNIHPDILCAFHRRVLLSDGETANAHSLIQGATSYIASGSIGRSTGQWSETLTPIYTDDTDQGQWIDFCFEIGVIGGDRC